MQNDEHAIRALVSDWHMASADGDVQRLAELMSEDVIFLAPGQVPMQGRDAFINAFKEGMKHYRIEAHGEVQEVSASGDLAYCRTQLSVVVTPHREGMPMRRYGYALSVLRRQPGGGWVIVRDANMLTAEPANLA